MKKILISFLALFILISAGCSTNSKTSKNQTKTQGADPMQPPNGVTIDKNKDYTAKIQTSMGEIELKLYPKEAPVTVNNFVYLAEKGFYDGTIFHRVIPDFMIQGGDPGTGRGGLGYQFEDEINSRKLVKGTLAMANAGPDTNGSQFFIVTADSTPWLDGKHTVFGTVTKGLDLVLKISKAERDSQDKPLEDIVLKKVTISSK